LRWHCDWFLWLVLGFRHGLCFVPEPLGEVHVYSDSYANRSRWKAKTQLPVLRKILEFLEEERYQDVAPYFRESGLLGQFGKEMLWVILSDKRHHKYLTATYLRRVAWWIPRIEGKKILPKFAVELYFKLSGHGNYGGGSAKKAAN